jgi:hypothetical protein
VIRSYETSGFMHNWYVHKKFDKQQARKESANMCCVGYAARVRSTKHSKAAYYLKNDPDTDGPKRRNMCDESDKEHGDPPAWK